ncbi:hypothetical protein FOZ76_07280 [Verticiella sediminum]|uniref:Lipoprotein n=1 Tax=Verticiella sediminum TaxID=1247510 RepID=A0A556AVX9_9BURK|nr:DUF6491 family protein [Verticiella sediminum]TSH97113.1 hypothetical protein FOZ76_07280 [Verticiella sediminum]
MNAISKLAGLALAATLAGCAAMQDAPPGPTLTLEQRLEREGYRQGEAVDRIPGFGLSSWNYLDAYHILVENGPSDDYLLTFSLDCRDLEYANAIAHTSTVGSLARMDRVVARAPGRPIECPIRAIHELERIDRAGR